MTTKERLLELGIQLTSCGQPGPYQDTQHVGTITAVSEEVAKANLCKMMGVKTIFEKQDKEKWSSAYFSYFERLNEHSWRFRIVQEYTG